MSRSHLPNERGGIVTPSYGRARYRRGDAAPPRGRRSEPVPRVVAVAAGGAAGAVGFVRVLVGVGELLFHQGVMLSAVLRTGRQAVPALASPLVVVVLVGAHEAAPLEGRVVRGVRAVPPALALRGQRSAVRECPRPGPALPGPALPGPAQPSSSSCLSCSSRARLLQGRQRAALVPGAPRPAEYYTEHEK